MSETDVNRHREGSVARVGWLRQCRRPVAIAVVSITAVACATRPAPDFAGRWRPVNRYAESPSEIPLHPAYTYRPSPVDGTLKTMLSRWARDARLTLVYEHPSDFTLHQAVDGIGTVDLQQAIASLNSAYAAHGVVITSEQGRIAVRALAPHPRGDAAGSH